MRAYKCDRCGGLFEKSVNSRYHIYVGSKMLDLCEMCTWSLTDWMTTEKKAEVCSGCHESKYKDLDGYCEPCKSCSRNHVDKFVKEEETEDE